jgi:hypothetical protein
MTRHEFAKLMTALMMSDDWQQASKVITEAFHSNDPEFNTVLDLFGQLRPNTPPEVRVFFYLMQSHLKLLALSRIHRAQQGILQGSPSDPTGLAPARR